MSGWMARAQNIHKFFSSSFCWSVRYRCMWFCGLWLQQQEVEPFRPNIVFNNNLRTSLVSERPIDCGADTSGERERESGHIWLHSLLSCHNHTLSVFCPKHTFVRFVFNWLSSLVPAKTAKIIESTMCCNYYLNRDKPQIIRFIFHLYVSHHVFTKF